MESKRTPPPPPPPPPAVTAALFSSVLGDDDLLREILLRLDFPTTLVRAALVSKRWLRHASDPAILRRFRALHPPRLLGFYHTALQDDLPVFVPLPQPPELAVALRRGRFQLGGASGSDVTIIFDCRNGRLLKAEFPPEALRFSIVSPLHPARDPPLLPWFPSGINQGIDKGVRHDGCMLLPEEGGDDLSYSLIALIHRDREFFAAAVSTQIGDLDLDDVRTSGPIELPTSWPKTMRRALLFHGNYYMLGDKSDILRLNLASMSMSLIRLPAGVEQLRRMGNLELVRAGDSGFYLCHLKGFQLHVWLHPADGDNDGNWVLVDTIPLQQSFGHVLRPSCELGKPNLGDAVVELYRVEDNAELLLQVDRVIFHINIANRTADKVHELKPEEGRYFEMFPFMMPWPPTFPVLKHGNYQDE